MVIILFYLKCPIAMNAGFRNVFSHHNNSAIKKNKKKGANPGEMVATITLKLVIRLNLKEYSEYT